MMKGNINEAYFLIITKIYNKCLLSSCCRPLCRRCSCSPCCRCSTCSGCCFGCNHWFYSRSFRSYSLFLSIVIMNHKRIFSNFFANFALNPIDKVGDSSINTSFGLYNIIDHNNYYFLYSKLSLNFYFYLETQAWKVWFSTSIAPRDNSV